MKKHRNRSMFYLLCILVVCVTAAAGYVLRSRIHDSGLASINHVEDLENRDIRIEYAFGKDVEENFTIDDFPGGRADPDFISTADVIAIVTPTGVIDQSYGSLGQEILVKQVIQGDDYAEVGRKSRVYGGEGFFLDGGKIKYINTLNLMYPGNDYLIFMDRTPLYEYEVEPTYTLKSWTFGYIKVNAGQRNSLPDEDYSRFAFSELKEYEFFSVSDKITNMLDDCMNEIVERYTIPAS